MFALSHEADMLNALTNSSFFSMLEVLTIFAMREQRASAERGTGHCLAAFLKCRPIHLQLARLVIRCLPSSGARDS
jgi:hypothetical protein